MQELPELVVQSGKGRVFNGERIVSIADVTPRGRMRFDAIARVLSDFGNDDTDDAGFDRLGLAWVARRSTMAVHKFPRLREPMTMATWCAGLGKRWAERRTTITGASGGLIEASALWVHVDPKSGRPTPWNSEFADIYGEAAQGRTVSSRLTLPKGPQAGADATHSTTNEMAWRFRQTDLDVFNHVNNAAYLAVLEEALGQAEPPAPLRVDIEWHRPIGAGVDLRAVESFGPESMMLWLQDPTENEQSPTTVAVICGGTIPE